jgi:uncharacterized protein YqgV (UPF0045/DUF77 family)
MMQITAEITMYPLKEDYRPNIIEFIKKLASNDGITIVTNQMSTQLSGEFDAVTAAVQACMREAMTTSSRVVFVAKYLNTGLDIARVPDLS